jgi:TRAP-type mannitol/chloroaromatic compound transport system substrate-binding protein
MFGFKERNNENSKEVEEKTLLKKKIISRIKYFRKKRLTNHLILEFSQFFRTLIIKLFHLNYEFTHEELEKELLKLRVKKRLRENIIKISSVISDVLYKDRAIRKDDFKRIISDTEALINELLPEEKIVEKTSFLHKYIYLNLIKRVNGFKKKKIKR